MKIDCSACRADLEAFLEGRLRAARRAQVAGHLAACAGCREIEGRMRGESERALLDAPPGLARSILERTSGPACPRSRDLLCDFTDGSLGETDAGLVRLHLEACEDCAALSRVLARLARDLPELAVMDPGPGFVRGVLAATSDLAPRPRVPAALDWLQGQWEAMLARPRIAWEAAYVGAILLFLAFGMPFSPLRDLPGRAKDLAVRPVAEVEKRVVTSARAAWQSGRERARGTTKQLAEGVGERLRRVEAAGSSTLEKIGGNLETVWSEMAAGGDDTEAAGTGPEEETQGEEP